MEIRIADTDDEIARCYPVLAQLRPHLDGADFVSRIRTQQAQGYRLARLERDGEVWAVAGFRLAENLAWGRFLYVDDLVTDARQRSRGAGKALFAWLVDFAREEGCRQLHLDSGAQRHDAHRFYLREGMCITGHHFALEIN